MPRTAPSPRRRATLVLAVLGTALAAALSGCGTTTNDNSGSCAPSSQGCALSATGTLAAQASTTVAGSGTTVSESATSSCNQAGSGRTDAFSEQVTLQTLPDGLQVGDIVVGSGTVPSKGQTVDVQYTGWLTNGTQFDSSRQSGRSAFELKVGQGNAIQGFDEAIASMHVGGVRRAVIPPALGYGSTAQGPIPAGSTLVFDLELVCAK